MLAAAGASAAVGNEVVAGTTGAAAVATAALGGRIAAKYAARRSLGMAEAGARGTPAVGCGTSGAGTLGALDGAGITVAGVGASAGPGTTGAEKYADSMGPGTAAGTTGAGTVTWGAPGRARWAAARLEGATTAAGGGVTPGARGSFMAPGTSTGTGNGTGAFAFGIITTGGAVFFRRPAATTAAAVVGRRPLDSRGGFICLAGSAGLDWLATWALAHFLSVQFAPAGHTLAGTARAAVSAVLRGGAFSAMLTADLAADGVEEEEEE